MAETKRERETEGAREREKRKKDCVSLALENNGKLYIWKLGTSVLSSHNKTASFKGPDEHY